MLFIHWIAGAGILTYSPVIFDNSIYAHSEPVHSTARVRVLTYNNKNMQTKMFTTIKVGYSVGVYGCGGEYFTTIIVRDGEMFSIRHSGMYGSDDRVNNVLKEAGYKETYTPNYFGKMTRKDGTARFSSEYAAIDEVKHIIVHGKYIQ